MCHPAPPRTSRTAAWRPLTSYAVSVAGDSVARLNLTVKGPATGFAGRNTNIAGSSPTPSGLEIENGPLTAHSDSVTMPVSSVAKIWITPNRAASVVTSGTSHAYRPVFGMPSASTFQLEPPSNVDSKVTVGVEAGASHCTSVVVPAVTVALASTTFGAMTSITSVPTNGSPATSPLTVTVT